MRPCKKQAPGQMVGRLLDLIEAYAENKRLLHFLDRGLCGGKRIESDI